MLPLEIIGVVLGVTGTLLLSSKLGAVMKWRYRVFLVYLISNCCMAVLMYWKGLYFALGMSLIYAIASINGLRNNRSVSA